MPDTGKKQSVIDFWKVKHQIDDEANRLGWSKNKCKAFILKHYGKDSRLVMTDEQLLNLLETLRNLTPSQITIRRLRNGKRKQRFNR